MNFLKWFSTAKVRRVIGDPSAIRVGSRVCLVQLDGCMATVRNNERWGRVIKLEDKVVYGSRKAFPFALIKLDNGKEEWQPAAPNELQWKGSYFERGY